VGGRGLSARRWGVLGGVFDPVHYAHLVIAEQARETLELDRVLFVPVGNPAHREAPRAAAEARAEMVGSAIEGNPSFALSRLEVDREGASYTVDTAQWLVERHPGTGFVFILSAESVSYLPEWREPERLLDLSEIAIVPRLGYADIPLEWLRTHFPGREERFSFVRTSHLGHSSSDIRARLEAGRSIRYLVPPAVEAYIGEHGLYGSDHRSAA
jgi:nicotinate-nucleotide adenylyltransferase